MGSTKLKQSGEVLPFDQVNLETIDTLYFMNLGLFKRVNLIFEGRESTADVIFDGDWIGFSGIPLCIHSFTAVSMETGHAWSIRYKDMLHSSSYDPALVQSALSDFSQQLLFRRHMPLTVKALSNDGRIADFLLQWSQSLMALGQGSGPFFVRMTRDNLGLLLGLDVESVHQALTNLAFHGVVEWDEKEPSDLRIPNLSELKSFLQSDVTFSRVVWQ
jgi:CRP/FNR family transcriptional regulator